MSNDYLKINKLGKVPSFVGADGYELTEAVAIAIYRKPSSSFAELGVDSPPKYDERFFITVIPDIPFAGDTYSHSDLDYIKNNAAILFDASV